MNTALFSHINWLAVIVAAVAYFMIGGLWYSKVLFGTRWAALQKIDMNDPGMKKGVAAIMFYSFLLMLLNVIGLAIFVARLDLTLISSGLKLGLVTGLFFCVTAVSISFVYERKPPALYFISGGYQLLGNIIAAIILVAWR
ncbi:MAG: rane protein [Chitinophagaceae bacterium]|nr:rane protein [Chitinophagaceae bacterium]